MENCAEVFGRLQPLCLELNKEPSARKMAEMREIVQRLNPAVLAMFQSYLLHPVRVVLHLPQPICESMLQHTVAVMKILLTTGPAKSGDEFLELFDLLTMKLANPKDTGRVATQSEENKLALVDVLDLLLEKAPFSTVEQLLEQPGNLPRVGHAVSLLLVLAEKESSVKLRVASLDCLLALAQTDKPYCKKVRSQLGNTLSFCLPGIVQCLSRILSSNTKLLVLRKALEVYSKVVTFTLADEVLELSHKESQKKASMGSKIQGKTESETKDPRFPDLSSFRSKEWVSQTAAKMAVLFDKLLVLSGHSQWKVRLALASFAQTLLRECTGSLKSCIPKLLQMLVSLIADDYDQVCTCAHETLQWYRCSLQEPEHQGWLREVLEDSLMTQVSALPRLLAFSDDATAVRVANTIAGYLTIMGPQVNIVLRSETHLKRLSLALLQALEVDSSNLHIMETPRLLPGLEKGDVDLTQQAHVNRPRRNFRYFTDQKVLDAVVKVLHLLGFYGNLTVLVEHFLDLFRVSAFRHSSAILVVNHLVQGASVYSPPETARNGGIGHTDCCNDSETVLNVISMLVETYVEWLETDPIQQAAAQESWHHSATTSELTNGSVHSDPDERWRVLPSSQSLVPASCPSLAVSHSSLSLQTLLMEGLGCFASVAGLWFESHLMVVLYPVLVRLGNEAQLLSHTAYLALHDMAQACFKPSVGALLKDNVDFLVDAVSARLRHLPSHLEAPGVLHLALAYCGQSALPILQPLLLEVLDCFENYHTEYPLVFAKVLRRILQTFSEWTSELEDTTQTEEPPKAETDPKTEDVVEYLRDLQKTMKISDSLGEDLELSDSDDDKGDESRDENKSKDEQNKTEKFFTNYSEKLSEAQKEAEQAGEEEEKGQDGQMDEQTDNKDPYRTIVLEQTREILLRCKHLLLSKSRELTLAVLAIIQDGCLLLRGTEGMIWQTCHQLWQPIVSLFRRDVPIVQQRVFQVIRVMSEACGDFLRSRIKDEVFPSLLQTLDRVAANHLAKASPSTLSFLQQLLSSLGPMSAVLNMHHEQLEKIATVCVKILIHCENQVIVKACREALDQLAPLDSDLLWYLGLGAGVSLGGEGGTFPGPPFHQHLLSRCNCPQHRARNPSVHSGDRGVLGASGQILIPGVTRSEGQRNQPVQRRKQPCGQNPFLG